MHEELDDVHLLPRELVPDGGAGGVAVWPRAAVNQMDGAAFGGGLVVPIVVEAAVPAVQCPRQGGAFHLHVDPVTKTHHKRALLAQEQGGSGALRAMDLLSGDNFMREAGRSKHGSVNQRGNQSPCHLV